MERTYVFGDPSGNGGAANNLLASILPSLQNRGIDTGYLMGLMGGNGNGGFFGNNGGFQDIIALIVIAAIFWGLLLKIIRDMICEYVDLSLNLHHEEGDSYTKRG